MVKPIEVESFLRAFKRAVLRDLRLCKLTVAKLKNFVWLTDYLRKVFVCVVDLQIERWALDLSEIILALNLL